jgi:hypothetical protein
MAEKDIEATTNEKTPPTPIDEELGMPKEEFDTRVDGLLSDFGLTPETSTGIDYKRLKKWAVSRLVSLIALADHKVNVYCRPKADKINWARLEGYNLQILNSILKEQDIEELKKKMELLENGFIKNRQ